MSAIYYRDLTFRITDEEGPYFIVDVEWDTLSNAGVSDYFIRSSRFRFSNFPSAYMALRGFCYLIYGESPRFDIGGVREIVEPDYPYMVE